MVDFGYSHATVLHALKKANGREDVAVNMLLDESVTPQAEDCTPSAGGGAAEPSAPKGYYANVITGNTSLNPPPSHTDLPHPSLPAMCCDAIAKSIESIGAVFKPFADQIVG
jgi:hypothetical protein